jgi:hypothetical protein
MKNKQNNKQNQNARNCGNKNCKNSQKGENETKSKFEHGGNND